ncbi:MAG: hypothetical protein K8T25_09695 [Planctomycetia bacterium]|nr:hypothetical protein [Planctomycetia bacterium]
MNCQQLAARIEEIRPGTPPRDVARLCLLFANSVNNMSVLEDERELSSVWKSTGLRLQAATDQHAAMTEELERLATTDPDHLNADQIWVLVRAIKVQSQILQLYLGQPGMDE